MNKKQREARDEYAATAAVHMATAHDKKPGIGVDDDIKVEFMVARVRRIADAQGLAYEIDVKSYGTYLRFPGGGWVYVFAADKLMPPSFRGN